MIATRGMAGRAVLSFVRQVSLSVVATLTATVVVAQLQARWATRPAAPNVAAAPGPDAPGLTDGGKFAARAIAGDEPEPFVSLMRLPAVLPMFTAPVVPQLRPDLREASIGVNQKPVVLAIAGAERAAPRRDLRRAGPVPRPRAGAEVVAMAPPPVPVPVPPPTLEDPSLWSRSKSAYQMVASWSGAMVDRLLP